MRDRGCWYCERSGRTGPCWRPPCVGSPGPRWSGGGSGPASAAGGYGRVRYRGSSPCQHRAALRDQLGISLQAIGAGETHTPALQAFEEPLQGSSVTTAQLPVEEPSRSAITSRPDPVLAGPFLRECHMSSSSTTTARPLGLGFWA